MQAASAKTKRTVAIVLALLLVGGIALAAATVGLGKPSIPDGAVAVVQDVDGETVEISDEDLAGGLDQAAAQLGLPKAPPEDNPQYQDTLNAAMQELLLAIWLEGEAADRGISVTDEEIATELEQIKEEGFASEKEFQEFVERSKFTEEDVNKQVELTLLREQLEADIVPKDPSVSQDEIEEFYEVHVATCVPAEEAAQTGGTGCLYDQPAGRDVRVVLNSSKAKVEQAKQELEADDSEESWAEVARKYSEDPASQDRGGLLEDLVQGQSDPQLEAQAFSAAEGELVGPFETDRGFYLLQVTAINEATTRPLSEVEGEIEQQLKATKQQQIANDFQTSFVEKWTKRTICDEEATIELCDNFEETVTEPEPGSPEAEAAFPPPVASSQPIAPGTAAPTADGSPQQGPIQRPRTVGDECADPDDVASAIDSGELLPGAVLEPCGPDDELPAAPAAQIPPGSVPIGPDGQPAPGAAPPTGAAPAPAPAPPPAPAP